eukprot:Lankesteria_metandrocarpae@DN5228_c0_g1_i9.p1
MSALTVLHAQTGPGADAMLRLIQSDSSKHIGDSCSSDRDDYWAGCKHYERPVYQCSAKHAFFLVCDRIDRSYVAARGMSPNGSVHKFDVSTFGVDGARALAYLSAAYGASPNVNDYVDDLQSMRPPGVTIAKDFCMMTIRGTWVKRKSVTFSSRNFGRRGSCILGIFAATLVKIKSSSDFFALMKTEEGNPV